MIDDAFGEFIFLLAQKKNQKKGTLPLMLRKGSAGQRTTTITIDGLFHYEYCLSLTLQSSQQVV
jgi:hypothetical protein